MNPFGFIAIGLGVLFIIIGIKGSQHNLVAALTGHGAHPVNTTALPMPSQPAAPPSPGGGGVILA